MEGALGAMQPPCGSFSNYVFDHDMDDFKTAMYCFKMPIYYISHESSDYICGLHDWTRASKERNKVFPISTKPSKGSSRPSFLSKPSSIKTLLLLLV